MEKKDEYYGIVWNTPITLNYVMYDFDAQGRVIKETNLNGGDTDSKNIGSAWEYDPANDKWRYYEEDATGNKQYLKNTVRGIKYNDQTYYYMFDENGYMRTGLVNYRGDVYYLQENGALKGSVFVGILTIGGKHYTFDEQGKYVGVIDTSIRALTNTEKKVDAYPVGENGDPNEGKHQTGASPLKTFAAKVFKLS